MQFVEMIPKIPTLAAELVETYGEAVNGCGVTVAVLDTGIDPGAHGLQYCPDGRRKLIDVVDATGSGDTAMTKCIYVPELDDASSPGAAFVEVEGASGRALKVPTSLAVKSGVLYLGVKAADELFSSTLLSRVKKESRKEDEQLHSLRAEHSKCADRQASLSAEKDKKEIDELKARSELLDQAMKSVPEIQLNYDCIVFQDRQTGEFCAVVDEDRSGDLSKATVLREFHLCHEYSTFRTACETLKSPHLNFAVHFYDSRCQLKKDELSSAIEDARSRSGTTPVALSAKLEGLILSIVTDCGSHGTHVGGIIGACVQTDDGSELNESMCGVAPGVQIVSVKIGDHRLGSMETPLALSRALATIRQHNCDLANLSYGEATSVCRAGRFIELIGEALDESKLLFVSSAGNEGPALSTVGAPGGTAPACLGVGACVTPQMMKELYSFLDSAEGSNGNEGEAGDDYYYAVNARQYTWSSRGPTADGHRGVCISAPGGAITSVPQWTLQRTQLMNGTSMSSPNACGCIALILSAYKHLHHLPAEYHVSPYRLRRAIENTAAPLPGVETFAGGHGVIQCTKALDYLAKSHDQPHHDVQYGVTVGADGDRGVYIRDVVESSFWESPVHIGIQFHSEVKTSVRQSFDKSLSLRIQVNDDVSKVLEQKVVFPSSLHLPSTGRSFPLRINMAGIPQGIPLFAEIVGELANDGIVVRVPITIIRPVVADTSLGMDFSKQVISKDEYIWRRFAHIPSTVEWVKVKLTVHFQGETSALDRKLFVHALQVDKNRPFKTMEHKRFVTIKPSPEGTYSFRMKVVPSKTLELCIAQYWACGGLMEFDVEIQYHSLAATVSTLSLDAVSPIGRVDLRADHRREALQPVAKIEHLCRPIRPASSTMTRCESARDEMTRSRVLHALKLAYSFKVDADAEITPKLSLFDGLLYESPIELGCHAETRRACGKMVKCVDFKSSSIQLKKGSYTASTILYHEDIAVLKRFESVPLVLSYKLKKDDAVTLPLFATYPGAVTATSKLSTKKRHLEYGDAKTIFVSAADVILSPKLKWAAAGDWLQGTFMPNKKIGQSEGGGYPLKVAFVTPSQSKAKDSDDSHPKGGLAALADTYLEAMKALRKRGDNDGYGVAATAFKEAFPGTLKDTGLGGLSFREEIMTMASTAYKKGNTAVATKMHQIFVGEAQSSVLKDIAAISRWASETVDFGAVCAFVGRSLSPSVASLANEDKEEKQLNALRKKLLLNRMYWCGLAGTEGADVQTFLSWADVEKTSSLEEHGDYIFEIHRSSGYPMKGLKLLVKLLTPTDTCENSSFASGRKWREMLYEHLRMNDLSVVADVYEELANHLH